MADLEVRLLDRIRTIPKEAWDALLLRDSSPFIEWTWLDALEEAGCVGADAGWIPRHIAVYRGRELLAVAPSYVKANSEGEFVFDWSWADLAHKWGLDYYPKVVLGIPFTPVTGDRVLVAPGEDRPAMIGLIAFAARKWAKSIDASGVHILFPTEDETDHFVRSGFRRRLGFQFHWSNANYKTVDDFLARYNSKKRNQIKREMAQPERDGITIETLAEKALDAPTRDLMFQFYAATVDKFFYGRRYLTRPFFDIVVERFAHRLAWVVARDKSGEAIAGAFNVQKNDRLYGRYWGATKEVPFLHFNVCYYHGIREAIKHGWNVFEPGAGGEHKHVRGFLPTYTYSAHHLDNPRLASVVYSFIEREEEAIREHVERANGEGPLRPVRLADEG